MTQLDYAVILVASAVGVLWDHRVSWGILAVWALLKVVHAL